MNALIFAAGLGTRLKPLTDTMPKAMVPVGGSPLLQILIERLKKIGVDEIVINVHHFAEQIISFVEQNNSFGINIKFSDEREMLLETGGGLKKAAALFSNSNPILVHNVDILSTADLQEFYKKANCTTLLVSERKTQRYLLFDNNDCLVGWTNIATGEIKGPDVARITANIDSYRKYAFSGIQVFNPALLPLMDTWEGKFSIIDFYLSVCDKVEIKCRLDRNLKLLDVGKLDSLQQAEDFLATHS